LHFAFGDKKLGLQNDAVLYNLYLFKVIYSVMLLYSLRDTRQSLSLSLSEIDFVQRMEIHILIIARFGAECICFYVTRFVDSSSGARQRERSIYL